MEKVLKTTKSSLWLLFSFFKSL